MNDNLIELYDRLITEIGKNIIILPNQEILRVARIIIDENDVGDDCDELNDLVVQIETLRSQEKM